MSSEIRYFSTVRDLRQQLEELEEQGLGDCGVTVSDDIDNDLTEVLWTPSMVRVMYRYSEPEDESDVDGSDLDLFIEHQYDRDGEAPWVVLG